MELIFTLKMSAGAHLEAALSLMNMHGRIPLCGMIAHYNDVDPTPGPTNLSTAIGKRLKLQGFIVTDYADRTPEFYADMRQWISEGRMHWEETVVEGLESAPQAFIGLFKGENIGQDDRQNCPERISRDHYHILERSKPMDLGLKGKRAIVTGGSRGIGRCCALALAREGARVCITARTQERLAEVIDEINGAGGEGHAVAVDLTSLESCQKVVSETVEHFGGVDILVNCAGAARGADILDLPTELI